MISKEQAARLMSGARNPTWFQEDFAQAVVRIDLEIRESAKTGANGLCPVLHSDYIPALVLILRQYGFDAKSNAADKNRIDIQW